jgi:hypothetical protein
MPTQMSVPPSAELPFLPDTLSQSSGPTIHPNFFLIWANKLISTKPGNFDNTSKPCRLNYPIWNVLTIEQISNGKLKCSIMAFANILLVMEGCRY